MAESAASPNTESGVKAEQMEDIPISTVDSSSVVLELIYQLKIKDVMATAVITGEKSQTLRHIQAIMRENHITGVPILEGQRLVGLVSIDDIVTALDKGYIDLPVEERMTKNVIVLQDDMPLSFAISYLNKYRYGRFPVLNKNQELVGILTSTDVIKTLLVEMNREVLRLEKIQKEYGGASLPYSAFPATILNWRAGLPRKSKKP